MPANIINIGYDSTNYYIIAGDLTHESMLSEDDVIARESWHQIRRRGARIVYPAHGILGTPEF